MPVPLLDSQVRLAPEKLPGHELWLQQAATIVALTLGAGLKVAELERCTFNCIDLDGGWIDMDRSIAIRPHRTPLLEPALVPVKQWLHSRGSRGTLLFPALRVDAKSRSIDAASIFRAVQRVCRDVPSLQHEAQRISPQTLRNSYVATLIDQGQSAALITEYLGLSRKSSASRLMLAYGTWQRSQAAR